MISGAGIRARILIVDDEEAIRTLVGNHLRAEGYEVVEASRSSEALEQFVEGHPDAVVLDYSLGDGTALELLPRFQGLRPFVPVVILTGHGSIELAVQCVKEGAEQFLTKPVELAALQVALERALESQRFRRRDAGAKPLPEPDPFLGVSPRIRELAVEAKRVARSDSPILITGETGTGKGVLAAWLHRTSRRAEEPMVSLNCAALTHALLESELFGHEKGSFTGAISAKPGLLEVANRGTVFLDEIGDMDGSIQPKLLKVLEEKRFRRVGEVRDRFVDIRLVAATHQDLAARVADGRFRSDLFYRLCTIPLQIPPLRERREDIPVLAAWILDRLRVEMGRATLTLSEAARAALARHRWPGNLRELRNVLERAVLLADRDVLDEDDLRLGGGDAAPGGSEGDHLTLAAVERAHIQRVLDASGGNVEDAARRLGLSRSALYERLRHDPQGGGLARRGKPRR
jgi:DNA-binding NtrC family response regulator